VVELPLDPSALDRVALLHRARSFAMTRAA
jgi:hypothetical protein